MIVKVRSSRELENDKMVVLRPVTSPLFLKTTLRDESKLTRGKPLTERIMVLPSAVPVKPPTVAVLGFALNTSGLAKYCH